MINIFQYYCYRLYKYYLNGDFTPIISTASVVVFFAFVNIITIVDFVLILLNIHTIDLPYYDKGIYRFWPIPFIIPFWIIAYIYFKNQENYAMLENKFANEDAKRRRINGFLITLNFILSMACFISVLWMRQEMRGY